MCASHTFLPSEHCTSAVVVRTRETTIQAGKRKIDKRSANRSPHTVDTWKTAIAVDVFAWRFHWILQVREAAGSITLGRESKGTLRYEQAHVTPRAEKSPPRCTGRQESPQVLVPLLDRHGTSQSQGPQLGLPINNTTRFRRIIKTPVSNS